MPCPACKHTMQNLGLATNGGRTFWCPRCGTLKAVESGDFESHESPRLTRIALKGNQDDVRREILGWYGSVLEDETESLP